MKLSVITICYNSEKTVERTIKSVLGQTYKDFEYIIVDGGSKDSTLDIVRKYEPLFEGRMKWKSEPDKGIYDAMNKGIQRSTGDIIGIVNSDDWLEPTAMEHIVNLANKVENYKDCLFCGSMKFHYTNGSSQEMLADKNKFEKGVVNYSFNHGAYHPAIYVGSNVYNEVGLFDIRFRYAADIDFIARSHKEGKKFYFTNAIVTNMADGGISNAFSLKNVIADKKLSFKKRDISGVKARLLLCYFCVKLLIKRITPTSLLEKYRRSNFNLQ